jgi:CelD/BcsL family acetyltransferase involved in cellulose biosynthesis
METRTLRGSDVLDRLGPRLDGLHAATGAPVTARRPWLATWVRCQPAYEPFALCVEGADRLEAVALLARKKQRLFTELVALGAGLSDQIRLPARDPEASRELARAVVALVLDVHGPWRLTIRHLPPDDGVARAIAAELGCAELETGDASPSLRFDGRRSLRSYVSKNHHQQVRRMRNRMHGEGLLPRLEHLREREAIAAILPEVVDVCLRRDASLRGESLLDQPGARAFFREVILEHAARGEVELTTLRFGDVLAAYVVCFLDRGAYRMWNCRLNPAWSRYGAGRVALDAAVERALLQGSTTEFDWMRGAETYKQGLSNHVEHALDLRAWSSIALRSVLDSRRRFKRLVKNAAAGHDWLQPVLGASRRLKFAGRRGRRAITTAIRRARG